MFTKSVFTSSNEVTMAIFGSFDSNSTIIESAFDVKLYNRAKTGTDADEIIVSGEDEKKVDCALAVISRLASMVGSDTGVSEQTVEYLCSMQASGDSSSLDGYDGCIVITAKGRPIKAKTVGQKEYVDKIKKNTIVLGIGPAGTGKTFLAVAMAVKALRAKEVNRIILTRPAVEAGERLGFLPGDLQSKIDPYLRPLYDALYEMLGSENYQKQIEKNTIEIAPLAYMRGRTLDDSFIILDEAQNTTPEQMKMFLTRLGFNSKVVVTGDLSQTDLPFGKKSGLAEAVKILDNIDGIAVHRFSERDVVRHRLVQRIILAYEKYESQKSHDQKEHRQIRFKKDVK